MSLQRKRGQTAKIYKSKVVRDIRNHKTLVADADGPYPVRAAFIPQRSSRAEVPGQQKINVFRMIVRPDLEDITLWSLVEWDGKFWDIVTPPAYHHGSRQVRHWSVDIRERPSDPRGGVLNG